MAPTVTRTGRTQASQRKQHPVRHQGKKCQRSTETGQHNEAQAQFAGHPQHEQREHRDT